MNHEKNRPPQGNKHPSGDDLERTLEQSAGHSILESTLDDTVPVRTSRGGKSESDPAAAIGRESADDSARARYTVNGIIGSGANGQVYTLHDNDLDREVAAKLPAPGARPEDRRSLFQEARLAACMEHPNIMPIYDVDRTGDHGVYFTMKKISGESLVELIRRATAEPAPPAAIKDTGAILSIFTRICDAVAYAHSKGIIHRDIKPANIMVGAFGEVLLIDWGTARRITDPDLTVAGGPSGSPAYMSPEQARGEPATRAGDIYAVGASLFHALARRHPTRAKTAEEFWERKRRGEIDPLTKQELTATPAPLAAIMLKAIAPQPKDRYQTVVDLGNDLRNFRNGLAVNAYQDTLWAWALRWYRRSRHVLIPAVIAAAVAIGSGALLYQTKLKEVARWGKPLYSESFTGDAWKKVWLPNDGVWESADGRLTTVTSPTSISYNIFYNKRLMAEAAIEFDCMTLPGAQPGDLSVVWADTLAVNDSATMVTAMPSGYKLQNGAKDNAWSLISEYSPNGYNILAQQSKSLTAGVRYHVRAEIGTRSLSLFVDGRRICYTELLFPFKSGYFGFYGTYVGKTFDNVRIYQKGLAEKVGAVEIGDAMYKQGLLLNAARSYDDVIASHPGTPLAEESIFKKGLCLYEVGRKDEAQGVWAATASPVYRCQIMIRAWDDLARDKRFDLVIRQMDSLYQVASPVVREQIHSAWSRVATISVNTCEFAAAENLLRFRDRRFPPEIVQDQQSTLILGALDRQSEIAVRYPLLKSEAAWALWARGSNDEVITRYPQIRLPCLFAYGVSGRAAEGMKKYPEFTNMIPFMHMLQGKQDSIFIRFPHDSNGCAVALIDQGKYGDAIRRYPTQRIACAWALLKTGELQKVVDSYPEIADARALALLCQGRYEETMKVPIPGSSDFRRNALYAMVHLDREKELFDTWPGNMPYGMAVYGALRQFTANGASDFTRLDSLSHEPVYLNDETVIFSRYLVVPFLHLLQNRQSAFGQSFLDTMDRYQYAMGQRLWYCGRYVAGRVTREAFLKQPVGDNMRARLHLCDAMRAELDGRPGDAVKGYQGYLDLPLYQKVPSVVCELFAQWRIEKLGDVPPSVVPGQ